MDQERYVSTGDGNVYLTSVDPFDTYEVTLSDMINHNELPKLTEADNISFNGIINTSASSSSDSSSSLDEADKNQSEDRTVIDYTVYREDENTFTYCSDDIYFTNSNGEILALDTSKIKSYLSTIGSTKHTDYVTYNASADEITQYGLDDP